MSIWISPVLCVMVFIHTMQPEKDVLQLRTQYIVHIGDTNGVELNTYVANLWKKVGPFVHLIALLW